MSTPTLQLCAGALLDSTLSVTLLWTGTEVVVRLLRAPHIRHRIRCLSLLAAPCLLAVRAWQGASASHASVVPPWVVGGLLTVAILGHGLWQLRALAAGAIPLERAEGVTLLESTDTPVPITWGWWRPLVVLPLEAASWSMETRQMALDHELAHIRRRDWATQTLTYLACSLFWFHPLGWWIRRQALLDAELAADARVLRGGAAAKNYAHFLLDQHTAARVSPGVTAMSGSSLGTRVEAVLQPQPTASRRSLWVMGALIVCTAALAAHPLTTQPEPECRAP